MKRGGLKKNLLYVPPYLPKRAALQDPTGSSPTDLLVYTATNRLVCVPPTGWCVLSPPTGWWYSHRPVGLDGLIFMICMPLFVKTFFPGVSGVLFYPFSAWYRPVKRERQIIKGTWGPGIQKLPAGQGEWRKYPCGSLYLISLPL